MKRSTLRRSALRTALVTCVATVATPLVAVPADAYCYSGNKWSTASRDVYQDTSSTSGVPSSWNSAIQASGNAWNGVTGSNWNMSVKTWGTNGPPASGGWVRRGSGSANPGWTISSATQGSSTMTWADSYLNRDWTWNGTMNQANKTADIRTVTTHEFGHWLRLLHPNQCSGEYTLAEQNAVMTPNYVVKQSLNSDDRAASAAVY